MKRTLLYAALTLTATAGCGSEDTPPRQAIPACDGFEATYVDPNPANAWTPNAIRLESQKLADNVFAIHDTRAPAPGVPLATSGGFVIGADGVLMIETMINRQLFCQAVALIREQTDKPILHAINTSHHGDHSYGNAFLPEGVEVIQHAATAAFISDHFDADVAWMSQNFGADQGLDEVTPRAADILVDATGHTIDLGGGVRVEARYHGFGQTHGDLFVWSEDARALWTGNPLVSPAPGIPWLLDGHATEVRDTLTAVRAALPDGARVVPGHSAVTDAAGFDFSIAYLDALIDGVQDSIDAGLTLDETVAAVTLDDFRGYALWDWIHVTVNVPATYAELSAAR
ncbi:MAG: MBL fold metallo-hydrolase [Myxococcales bacterium]|nr:MBL fold metallo-hydrolase [Myxococcales bacterium]